MNKIVVIINDENVYEFDKNSQLDDQQLKFLDKMDSDMDQGIKIKGELILDPDHVQRAHFVAMNLIKALQQENETMISASCAYLANRFNALREVHLKKSNGTIEVELVEEH